MLRAAILEKSKEHRAYIRAALTGMELDIEVCEFSNKYDYLNQFDKEASSFDILLLNTTICEEGDGVKLAEYIRLKNRKMMLCFVTDSKEYYAEAFAVLATGYFLYPFNISELQNCIWFFWQKPNIERRSSLMIKETGGSYRRIYCRNIQYIESSNRKAFLHLETGEIVETYAKLDELEKQLPKKMFFRCHQSFVIHLFYAEKLESGKFVIQSEKIPISRKYLKEAKMCYQKYLSEKR